MLELDETFDEESVVSIANSDIVDYAIYRSPTDYKKFNVVALAEKSKPLFVVASDLEIEEAMQTVKEMRLELYTLPSCED